MTMGGLHCWDSIGHKGFLYRLVVSTGCLSDGYQAALLGYESERHVSFNIVLLLCSVSSRLTTMRHWWNCVKMSAKVNVRSFTTILPVHVHLRGLSLGPQFVVYCHILGWYKIVTFRAFASVAE